jgi:hypothetical protein
MADHTIAADEIGAYELALTPNTAITIAFETQPVKIGVKAHVIVHAANAPVYVRTDNDVTPLDPKAVIVDPGTWADIPLSDRNGATISLVSVSAATISVTRA